MTYGQTDGLTYITRCIHDGLPSVKMELKHGLSCHPMHYGLLNTSINDVTVQFSIVANLL